MAQLHKLNEIARAEHVKNEEKKTGPGNSES